MTVAGGLWLAGLPTAAQAGPVSRFPGQQPNDWKYSFSLGPSFFAPRMNALDSALRADGVEYIERTYKTFTTNQGSNAAGFPKTGFGFGGQIQLQYEFNEDLRGGLQISLNALPASGSITLTNTDLTTAPVSTTDYDVSHRTSLPVVQIGLSLQKVFRFEEEPQLRLYLGGWGSIGVLVGATLKGSIREENTGTTRSYSATLRGQGWGAGGLGGAEYQLSHRYALFGESGFEYFIVRSIETSGTIAGLPQNARPFLTRTGRPIDLDFSGIFIRIGVKASLGSSWGLPR